MGEIKPYLIAVDELENDLNGTESDKQETTLTEGRLKEMNSLQRSQVDDKMQSIMNFLDEVKVAERLSEVDQVRLSIRKSL